MRHRIITIAIATDRDRYVNRYPAADTPDARSARALRIASLIHSAALTEGERRLQAAKTR